MSAMGSSRTGRPSSASPPDGHLEWHHELRARKLKKVETRRSRCMHEEGRRVPAELQDLEILVDHHTGRRMPRQHQAVSLCPHLIRRQLSRQRPRKAPPLRQAAARQREIGLEQSRRSWSRR